MSRRIEAVVFDLDDTLYLERDYVRSGFHAVDAALADEGVHGFFDVAWGAFEQGVRGNVFDRALTLLGASPDPARIARLVEVYRAHEPTLTLLDDAAWALTHVRDTGHRTALLTDGYLQVQQRKANALALPARMDTVVYTDALGRAHWKPSPVPYEAVMTALACAGDRCLYVGDNPTKDFVSPHALGWLTVRVVRSGGEHADVHDDPASRAHHTVHSLRELAGILARPHSE